MTKWLVAFVCLAGVVSIAIRFLWSPSAGRAAPAAGDGTAAVAEMREEIAALRQAIGRSERLAGAAASAAVMARAPVRPAPSDPPSAEATKSPAPTAISDEEAYHRLGQRFQSEATDEKWAVDAQPKARQQVLTTLGSVSNIRELDCRLTTCKAAIIFANKDAYQHAMASLVMTTSPAWTGTITYLPPKFGSDGSVELDEYLFRDGTNLMGDIYAEGTERQ